MESPFIPTSDGKLINIRPVRHKWNHQPFREGTCRIYPAEENDFEEA